MLKILMGFKEPICQFFIINNKKDSQLFAA